MTNQPDELDPAWAEYLKLRQAQCQSHDRPGFSGQCPECGWVAPEDGHIGNGILDWLKAWFMQLRSH